jgi:hypothetical protein
MHMTEDEWLTSSDADAMLAFLGSRATDRIRRLFACACCRRVWDLLTDERSREAVRVAEEFAEGRATLAELTAARQLAQQAQTDAKQAEWYAEAEADFCYTAEYCAVSARLCAACAARAAVSVVVAEPDGGWECYMPVDPDFEEVRFEKLREGSHNWAASAVGEAKRSAVYFAREAEKPALHNLADVAGHAAGAAEAAEQTVVLRELFGNPFRKE